MRTPSSGSRGRSAAGQDQWWWGWLKYTVLKDVQGHPLRGLGTCQDITDKMDAEAKYKEAMAHRMAANEFPAGLYPA
jgi:PAS domain-containing protein